MWPVEIAKDSAEKHYNFRRLFVLVVLKVLKDDRLKRLTHLRNSQCAQTGVLLSQRFDRIWSTLHEERCALRITT